MYKQTQQVLLAHFKVYLSEKSNCLESIILKNRAYEEFIYNEKQRKAILLAIKELAFKQNT